MSSIIKNNKQAFKVKDISNDGVITAHNDFKKAIDIKTESDKYKQNKTFAKSSETKIENYKNKVNDTKKMLTTDYTKKVEKDAFNPKNKKEEQENEKRDSNTNEKSSKEKENEKEKAKLKNKKKSFSKRALQSAEYTFDQVISDDEDDLGIDTLIRTKTGIKGTITLNDKTFEINKKIGVKAYNVATSEQAKELYTGAIETTKKVYEVTENTYNKIYIKNKVNSMLKKGNSSCLKDKQRKKVLEKVRKKIKEQAENVVKVVLSKFKNAVVSLFTKKVAIVSLIIITLVVTLISCIVGITTLFGFSSNLALDDTLTLIYEYISELDTNINYQIETAETTYTADEYVYNVPKRAETNKEQVYAYLKAKYGDEKISDSLIKAEIIQIHNNLYDLSFVETIRTYTITSADGSTSTHTIITMNITLTAKDFKDYYEENKDILLSKNKQKDYENILELIGENVGKLLNNPFPNVDWRKHITSKYGYRLHPITGIFSKHTGLDIGMAKGTEIHACMSGIVKTYNSGNEGFGLYLTITNDKYETLYAHCNQILVQDGQRVNAGDVIATVGSTGTSTGNHLHLEYLVNGVRKNPKAYLKVFNEK